MKFNQRSIFSCSFGAIILAFFWTVSLICGVCFSAKDLSVVVLMRLLPYSQVSIVGLFLVLFFPLLITILCFYFEKPIVFIVLLVIKGFFLGYFLYGMNAAFGDSGWLLRLLTAFSDSFMVFVLLWFGVRQTGSRTVSFRKDVVIAVSATLIIGILDYFLVSPFLGLLMNRI